MSAEPLPSLALHGVRLRRGGATILDAVELVLGPGLHALTGANGAGKSTLLRALAGLVRPDRGTIHVRGHALWHDEVAARRELGYLPESAEFFPTLTPRELIELVASLRGCASEPAREHFDRWVGAAAIDLRVGMLSAGQRRKLALALALLGDPHVLLLDEPANALDAAALADLRALLIARRAAGACIVVALHHAGTLGLEFDDWVDVAAGRVVGPLAAPDEPPPRVAPSRA
jgi:ABC-type multidrug transport system ATPase subunit